MNWLSVSGVNDLELFEQNHPDGYIIFKHSTRCGASSTAKKMFEREWTGSVPVILLPVIEQRNISNAVSLKYNVHHESPQLLFIKGGKCIYNRSHSLIDAQTVNSVISQAS